MQLKFAIFLRSTTTYGLAAACLLADFLCASRPTLALPDTPGQRAGEISRLIPAVSIVHGQDSLAADQKSPVYWNDAVHTLAAGRARVSLDDGSVLNVGSVSHAIITKHDAGAQQTDLALGLGKMRVQAQKISKPGGNFTVHTPTGTAGVVGTDFYVDYANGVMTVIVFTGRVKVCNLKERCVELCAGEMTSVSANPPAGPLPGTPAPPEMVAEALYSTSLETAAEESERVAHPLGFVAKASSSHIGAKIGAEGSPIHDGELLSTDSNGLLLLDLAALEIKLENGTAAHIYRTAYGAVVDLSYGSLVYKTPCCSQSLVIVAADMRITPSSETPGSGRVSLVNPCYLGIQSWRGQVYVLDRSKSYLVESERGYYTFLKRSVAYRKGISPDSSDYHNGHIHRACIPSDIHSPLFPGSGNPSSPGGPTGVPEPSTLAFFATGILALIGFKLRKLLKHAGSLK